MGLVFNPDITKQAIEVIFSVKHIKPKHPDLIFNEIPVSREDYTKHLGVYLDNRLNFSKHIKEAVVKATKGLAILKHLSKYVSQTILDLCYKLYIRPHLDYGDVIYHNQRVDLMTLLETVQYKAALIVSGCWQGTSRVKLYDELGWETLSDRRWSRRLCLFYKISHGLAPKYLADHIPEVNNHNHFLRRMNTNLSPIVRTQRYENSFFPFCITQWNRLEENVRTLPSINQFKKHIYTFIRPPGNPLFGIRDRTGTKLLTKIRVVFSDLRDHRFNHNFNCTSPLCKCGEEDETTIHYFLKCPLYTNHRNDLLSKISDKIGSNVEILPDEHLSQILLYGSNAYNTILNKLIIEESIRYIHISGRFEKLEAFSTNS